MLHNLNYIAKSQVRNFADTFPLERNLRFIEVKDNLSLFQERCSSPYDLWLPLSRDVTRKATLQVQLSLALQGVLAGY